MILVTGGVGYIGSHTCLALAEAGSDVLILDNLCNSRSDVMDHLKELFPTNATATLIQGDVRDSGLLDKIFTDHDISAVIHFAGLKAVGESTQIPLDYYDNNVRGSIQLLTAMARAKVKTFVFSSSATVYGDTADLTINEDSPRSVTNPYGRTKLMIEDVLDDLNRSNDGWKIARLRYFNPVGAHASGLIGEEPRGVPNNLMPYLAQVASGVRDVLSIYGNDYPTPDGTGVRDYIHVLDLAEGHVAALRYLKDRSPTQLTLNLGTGQGYSVLQMVKAFESACGKVIPYQFAPRRVGDVAMCCADPRRAKDVIGWVATRSLSEMCTDAWRWQERRTSMHRAS